MPVHVPPYTDSKLVQSSFGTGLSSGSLSASLVGCFEAPGGFIFGSSNLPIVTFN